MFVKPLTLVQLVSGLLASLGASAALLTHVRPGAQCCRGAWQMLTMLQGCLAHADIAGSACAQCGSAALVHLLCTPCLLLPALHAAT